jgi:hypothetical protein
MEGRAESRCFVDGDRGVRLEAEPLALGRENAHTRREEV